MMLQPSLSTTDARGGPPLLGLLDQATHIRTTEHGATWTRTTRSLELRLTAQREMMEDCGSRNGLATFLASGPAMSCDVDGRRSISGPSPAPLSPGKHFNDGRQSTARHSLTTISNRFRRIGSDGDWQLRIHPAGPALAM